MQINKSENFIRVLEAHKGIVYKIVNTYCKKWDKRKDLEQEILIQLWVSFDDYDSKYKYSTWIYRIALNVAISFYRKDKTWSKKIAALDERLFLNIPDNSENRIVEEENLQKLQVLINDLNDVDKAIMLMYLDEMSHQDIGTVLGISTSNVGTKISRTVKKIRTQF